MFLLSEFLFFNRKDVTEQLNACSRDHPLLTNQRYTRKPVRDKLFTVNNEKVH